MTSPSGLGHIRGYRREVPDWERRDMTVCIAATCDGGIGESKIVVCTDQKIGGALGSAETMLKARTICKNWWCLTAGTDSEIFAINILLRKHFHAASYVDDRNIVTLVRAALNERKMDKANELIQGKYAISYTEFLTTGKDRLPPDLFRSAAAEVELMDLDAAFIIFGYIGKFPWLIETNGHSQVKIREDFAVVGQGAYLAQASMLHRGHSDIDTLGKTLYSVYEAKKFAEGAPSVGKNTVQSVIYQDGRNELTSVKADNLLEAHYKKYGPRVIDSELEVTPDFFYKKEKP
jgi:hypothetical protein